MSQFFTSGGQSTGASASASVLPVNIQDRFPLELTGLIFLQSRGLSRVFSSTKYDITWRFFVDTLIRLSRYLGTPSLLGTSIMSSIGFFKVLFMSLLWWLYNFPCYSINMVIISIDFQMLNQSSWCNSPLVSNIFYMLCNSLQFCLGSLFCFHEWHYFTVFISCHIFCSRAVAQSLSAVQLFVTPWTATHQSSLSFTVSQSLPKFMSIESVMLSSRAVLAS